MPAPPKVPLSPEPAATGTRPVIPSSQSSFAEFKKQALEKEERVWIVWVKVWEQFSVICAGENSEGTRTTEITTEETNGIRATTTAGREKEVNKMTKNYPLSIISFT